MGLAILPGRLLSELQEVKKFLLQEDNQIAPKHFFWAENLRKKTTWNPQNVDQKLHQELCNVFTQILKDAGVFKLNQQGKEAFLRFCATFSQM